MEKKEEKWIERESERAKKREGPREIENDS